MNYDINYEDPKFKQVELDKQTALAENRNTYDNMINQSDKYYQDQINAAKDWANRQQEIQQANTDFAIEQVNQQKDQAQKDYTKEQAGAYVDWQKQSNQYGANAEQQAAQGLNNTGYSESSQVSMYNTYQNRVATARESYNKAVLNYDNAIKEAQLTNNTTLAEIAADALKNQQELALQGFQYKNTLIQTKQQQLQELGVRYDNKYQNTLSQINSELSSKRELFNTLASLLTQRKQLEENIRQANAEMQYKRQQLAYQKERDRISDAQWQKEYDAKYAYMLQNSSNTVSKGSIKEQVPTSAEEVLKKMTVLQGPGLRNNARSFISLLWLRYKIGG